MRLWDQSRWPKIWITETNLGLLKKKFLRPVSFSRNVGYRDQSRWSWEIALFWVHHHAIIIITIIIIIVIIIIFVIIIIIINPVWVNIAESPGLTLSPMDIFGKIPQKTSSAIFLKRSQWNILIVSNLLVGSAKEFAALVSPMMYFFQPGLCSTMLWNITN